MNPVCFGNPSHYESRCSICVGKELDRLKEAAEIGINGCTEMLDKCLCPGTGDGICKSCETAFNMRKLMQESIRGGKVG